MRRKKPVIGVTMGEPAGIGPEVVVKSVAKPQVRNACVPVVFGSSKISTGAGKRHATKF